MRILRRALVPLAFLALAVLAQVTMVNRLPLPGGATPDLVLLVVTALAVTGGPVPGMLAGFAGGLALDLAPPVSNLAGESAFVFCAAGYACGALAMQLSPKGAGSRSAADSWTRAAGGRDPGPPVLASLPVMVVGVGIAEALRAGLGLMLSDPRMTGPAITHILPAAVVYDILFCPLVLWLVAAALGPAEPASAVLGASEPGPAPSGRAVVRAGGVPGVAGGILVGGATSVPRLTFADTRQVPRRAPVAPPPKLRLAAHSTPSPHLTNRSTPAAAHLPRGAGWLQGSGGGWQKASPGLERYSVRPVRVAFGSGSRGGFVGGSVLGNRLLDGVRGVRGAGGGGFSGALGPSLFAGAGRRSTRSSRKPRRNWLSAGRGSVTRPLTGNAGITSGGLGAGLPGGRNGAFRSPGKGWLRPGKRSMPPRPGSPVRRPAAPGDGWMRRRGAVTKARWAKSASWSSASPGHRSSPGKGWIRPAKPIAPARRKKPGRGWLERKPARLTWQPKSPGKGWLGRGAGLRRPGWRAQGIGGKGIGAKALGSGRTRIGGRR